MLKIGITGGIGSGKSYVCSILEKMGYAIFYSDQEAQKIMLTNSSLIDEIKQLVGSDSYQYGQLNKPRLREFIFDKESNKEKINQLVHPYVYQAFDEWSRTITKKLVFNESALLFETGSYKRFDKTIVITSPIELKIERLITRDSLSKEEIQKRFSAQVEDDIKIEKADYVIYNNEKELLIPQIIKILEDLSMRL
jgi:dephospho-CoA kinase